MGCADLVPGISGGTIAFITGIYQRLLTAITHVNVRALKILKEKGFPAMWQYLDGYFLLSLGLGIGSALFSLASLISYLIEYHQSLLWSFFLGLVIGAALHMLAQLKEATLVDYFLLVLGVLVAIGDESTPAQLALSPATLFAAGSIAICALVLPGISGSFLLLVMGLYEPIVGAIRGLEFDILFYFALGAAFGLLLFARFIKALIDRYTQPTFAVLIGFMLGSSVMLWPQQTLSWRTNSRGEQVPFEKGNILPPEMSFEALFWPITPLSWP